MNLTLTPFSHTPLPQVSPDGFGYRHTIMNSRGDLIAGYVYAWTIAEAVEFAKANVPGWYSVANRSERVLERETR